MTTSVQSLPADPVSAPVQPPVFLPRFVREVRDLSPSLCAEFNRYVAAYDREATAVGDSSLLECVDGMKSVRFIEDLFDLCVLIGLHPHAGLGHESVINAFSLSEEDGADLWTLHHVGEEEPMLIVVEREVAEAARKMLVYDGGSSTPYGSIAWFYHKEAK